MIINGVNFNEDYYSEFLADVRAGLFDDPVIWDVEGFSKFIVAGSGREKST